MTRLAELLGIRLPVLLAAMAGGPGTPALAAAVTRSGGLGVIGITGMTRAAAKVAVDEARRAADGPIGVNAMLAPPTAPTGDEAAIAEVLGPFRRELGLAHEAPQPPAADPPDALVDAAVAAGAAVVTTFGHPGPVAEAVARAGIPLVAMVTTPAEAVVAVESGAAAVIAQGAEAGGHRGTFEVGRRAVPLVGLLALVPAIVEAVGPDVPVVASGGIVDRASVDAALAVGAAGISSGTVFLQAVEAGVGPEYRRALLDTAPDGTVVTDAVTGRPARWIRNWLVDTLVEAQVGHAGWPRQAALIGEIRAAASAQGRADILPMLAGQRSGATGNVRPAAEIVAELVPSALLR